MMRRAVAGTAYGPRPSSVFQFVLGYRGDSVADSVLDVPPVFVPYESSGCAPSYVLQYRRWQEPSILRLPLRACRVNAPPSSVSLASTQPTGWLLDKLKPVAGRLIM